jgi:hypothetical protein
LASAHVDRFVHGDLGGMVAIFRPSALALTVVNATTRYDAIGYE